MQHSTTSADATDWADRILAVNLKSLPTLPVDLLGTELHMTAHNVATGQAMPQDATYLAAIREEIARRGLTEADVIAAMEERIARLKANPPHTCCAACRTNTP